MSKTLIVKLNSRKASSEELENSLIQALQSCGLEYDGADLSFDGEFNRNLFFILPKDIDCEVLEDDCEYEDEDEDE
jgi:hypothetical protein